MALTVIKNDILVNMDPARPTVVLHGCNCFHTMGAGIALYLRKKFPQISIVDRMTSYGDPVKLGTMSVAVITPNFHIVNCYTQYATGTKENGQPPVDYLAVEACLEAVHDTYADWEIRMPKIGCGLAGGSWAKVEAIAEQFFTTDTDVTVYEI